MGPEERQQRTGPGQLRHDVLVVREVADDQRAVDADLRHRPAVLGVVRAREGARQDSVVPASGAHGVEVVEHGLPDRAHPVRDHADQVAALGRQPACEQARAVVELFGGATDPRGRRIAHQRRRPAAAEHLGHGALGHTGRASNVGDCCQSQTRLYELLPMRNRFPATGT
jgi:hypothetical protein